MEKITSTGTSRGDMANCGKHSTTADIQKAFFDRIAQGCLQIMVDALFFFW